MVVTNSKSIMRKQNLYVSSSIVTGGYIYDASLNATDSSFRKVIVSRVCTNAHIAVFTSRYNYVQNGPIRRCNHHLQ